MTKLDCTVSSCLYNKERCCCKDNIEVSGQNARHSRETCCRSFRERDAGQALSAVDIPTKNTEWPAELVTVPSMKIADARRSTSASRAEQPASVGRRSALRSAASASKGAGRIDKKLPVDFRCDLLR